MFSYVGGFVLLAALLHATWNAMLHGNRDRFLSMTWMSTSTGLVALIALPFLPMPAAPAFPYIIASGLVHIVYSVSLVYAYRSGDLGETYPIARGSSPLLVAVGAALFAREHLGWLPLAGILLVSAGIISLALERGRVSLAGASAGFPHGRHDRGIYGDRRHGRARLGQCGDCLYGVDVRVLPADAAACSSPCAASRRLRAPLARPSGNRRAAAWCRSRHTAS